GILDRACGCRIYAPQRACDDAADIAAIRPFPCAGTGNGVCAPASGLDERINWRMIRKNRQPCFEKVCAKETRGCIALSDVELAAARPQLPASPHSRPGR